MELTKQIIEWTGFGASIFTILASGIAIYLFLAKREMISSAFKALANYSFRISITELTGKLDRIADLTANEPSEKEEIVNILSDIHGQVRGNQILRGEFEDDLLYELSNLTKGVTQLTEPDKRSLVSELRERIRNINVENFGSSWS